VQPGLEFAVGKSTDRGHKKVRVLAQDQFAKRHHGPIARAFYHHIRLGPEQRINAVVQPNLWRRCQRRFRQRTHDVSAGSPIGRQFGQYRCAMPISKTP